MNTLLSHSQSQTFPTDAAPRRARRQSSVLPFVFAFAFLGFGLLLVGISWFSIRDGFTSSSWYHAQGTVLSSQVDTEEHTDSNGRTTYTYIPAIKYQYNVDSTTFTAHQVQFSANQYNYFGDAERIVSQYPTGSDVTVYYAPDDHSHSVLLPGVAGSSFIGMGVGILFAAIGVVLLVVIFKYLMPATRQVLVKSS